MENASKALLIAAAVLIAILIITIGIKIFSYTSDTQKVATNTGNTISTKSGQATDSAISAITGKRANVIDYGGKTKETVQLGDDISIGTEKFRIIRKNDNEIMALPLYNITLTENHPVQSSSAGTITFSTTSYWATQDNPIFMGDFRNNIQKYITAYQKTLEDLGAKGITVRAGKYFDELADIWLRNVNLNPKKSTGYWLSTPASNKISDVWAINSNGHGAAIHYNTNGARGVRPIIIIPLS